MRNGPSLTVAEAGQAWPFVLAYVSARRRIGNRRIAPSLHVASKPARSDVRRWRVGQLAEGAVVNGAMAIAAVN